MDLKQIFRSMSWVTSMSVFERLAALLQTVLAARVLGIHDYGIYGLLFGTIGLTASMVGVQMGLTATVFVARYREHAKSKAASVIRFVGRFGLGVSLLFLILTIPFIEPLARWLVGESAMHGAVLAGCILVALSIIGGVQDGVIQGFEDFRTVALVRLVTTLVSLALVLPLGGAWGLTGVMWAMVVGAALKSLYLIRSIDRHGRANDLPDSGGDIKVKELLWGFSIPSVSATVIAGVAAWYGLYILSRQPAGFADVAIASLGAQWRSPIALLVTAVSTVTIPAISRSHHADDPVQIDRIRRGALLFNGATALVAVVVISALAPLVLKAYGPDFLGGGTVFSLLVASALPQALATTYLQELVGLGQMWRQNLLYLFLAIPMLAGFHLFIPRYGELAYAMVNLGAWSVFLMALVFAERVARR
jgi:O-antigen/teichoic acid export membrane protein